MCNYYKISERGFLILSWLVREGAWDKAARDPNDEMVSAGLTPDNIRKWEFLTGIQGQNETVGKVVFAYFL